MAQRKPIAEGHIEENPPIEKISLTQEQGSPEKPPVGNAAGQWWGNPAGLIDIATLRRKLDSAILAEAWDAVKAIRERIVEVERAAFVDLVEERAKRGK